MNEREYSRYEMRNPWGSQCYERGVMYDSSLHSVTAQTSARCAVTGGVCPGRQNSDTNEPDEIFSNERNYLKCVAVYKVAQILKMSVFPEVLFQIRNISSSWFLT